MLQHPVAVNCVVYSCTLHSNDYNPFCITLTNFNTQMLHFKTEYVAFFSVRAKLVFNSLRKNNMQNSNIYP